MTRELLTILLPTSTSIRIDASSSFLCEIEMRTELIRERGSSLI